jgi:hypothetical protein
MMKDFSARSLAMGIVLGAALAGAWFFGGGAITFPAYPERAATGTNALTAPASGAVSVADQFAGDTVIVESVAVPPPGVWVAVREVRGGELGNVLGAGRASGPQDNFIVHLLRATEPDRPYAVELYRDDAGGIFDIAKVSAYVDFDTGARVVAYFRTLK